MGTGNWLCHSNSFFSVNEVHNGNCTMWERWTKLIKLFYQIMYKLCEGHGFHCLSMCFLFAFSVLLSLAQCSHEMWTFFVSWICLILCDKNPEHADVPCICPSEQQHFKTAVLDLQCPPAAVPSAGDQKTLSSNHWISCEQYAALWISKSLAWWVKNAYLWLGKLGEFTKGLQTELDLGIAAEAMCYCPTISRCSCWQAGSPWKTIHQ